MGNFRGWSFVTGVFHAALAQTYGIVSVSQTDTDKSDTDLTTYTFSTKALGAAATDRRIIAVIAARANAARSISSVTIGGISATALATANATGSGADICAVYQAAVPTGTTGDVVVTFDNTMLRAFVTVLRVIGWPSGTATASSTDLTLSAQDLNASISCVARGAIVGGIIYLNTLSGATTTWTNLTESSDLQSVEATNNCSSAAFNNFAAAQSSLSITATGTGTGSAGAMALVALSP